MPSLVLSVYCEDRIGKVDKLRKSLKMVIEIQYLRAKLENVLINWDLFNIHSFLQ